MNLIHVGCSHLGPRAGPSQEASRKCDVPSSRGWQAPDAEIGNCKLFLHPQENLADQIQALTKMSIIHAGAVSPYTGDPLNLF